MSLFNQYSLIIFGISGGLILGGLMWRFHRPTRLTFRIATLAVYGVVVLTIGFLQFPTSNNTVDTYEQIESVINDGEPTFVMMYSHFCVGCIAALPAARQLDDQLAEQGQILDLLFLDIHSDLGKIARENLGFRFTPTYILYDATGHEIYRSNSIPSAESIADLLAS